MSFPDNREYFLDTVIKENLFKAKFLSSKEKLRYNLENLFRGIDLKGKKVLDIGGGYGIHSFYAACIGAEEVICLEPEIEGSSESAIEKFRTLQNILGIEQVSLRTKTFQEFDPAGKLFDLILSHNSINHLDESACSTLLENENSKKIYEKIASKLAAISTDGGLLIICDCSSRNFFADLGIKNPFAPTITWKLHHPPEIWIDIFKKSGFTNPDIEWITFGEFRKTGKVIFGYRLISYFLNSHYCFRMIKSS